MSSSDGKAGSKAARRFLAVFAAAATLSLALLLTLCWAIDPTGLLRAQGLSPRLCGPGIANWDERHAKPLIAAGQQPAEIVLGSSRAARGFHPRAFGGRRVANLAVSAGGVSDIDRIARFTLDRGGLRRAWIETDFLIFAAPEPSDSRMTFPGSHLSGRILALRYGLFDWRALGAAIEATVFFGTCRQPPLDGMGFRRERPQPPAPVQISAELRANLHKSWSQLKPAREAAVTARLERFDRLIADLRASDVDVVLFVSPIQSAQREAFSGTFYEPLYREWRAAIAAIARRRGARLIASDDPAFLRTIPATSCPAAQAEDCLFYDMRHFRPVVGDAIVQAGTGD